MQKIDKKFRAQAFGLHAEPPEEPAEVVLPIMAKVTELKNGMWSIYLPTNAANSVHTVQCGQTSIRISSSITDSHVTLSLNKIPGEVAASKGSKPGPPLLKVHASYNGQMEEMAARGQGQWAAVSWPYVATHDPTNYNNHRFYQPTAFHQTNRNVYAAYQLILEFKESFAEGERQVLTHLSNLLDTQSMADVTFIVKNEKIGAHTAIVVSGSPVICAMLEENKFLEGVTKEVKIDDIDPLVLKEMLRYLYTGRAPKLDDADMTEPLFLAADKYQIEALKNLCEQSLIKKLNFETVIHHLVLAHLHSAPQLLEASLKFLEEHKLEVSARADWKQLFKSYPDLYFLASQRMIRS